MALGVLGSLAPKTITVAQEGGGVATWAILVAIDNTDNRTAVRTALRGLASRISGRDVSVITEPDTFTRFVLTDTNPEINVKVLVAVNPDVSQQVQNELANLPSVAIGVMWPGTPLSRTVLNQRLIEEARINFNAAKFWLLNPGEDTSGFLPDKFVEFAAAVNR